MSMGVVRRFDRNLGYGYIAPHDGSREVFVHFTALDRAGLTDLYEGQTVYFEKSEDAGVTRAVNLSVAEAA